MKTAMHRVDCATCGIVFFIQENLEVIRRRDGKSFYCPNGHENVYPKTDKDQCIKELKDKVKRLEDEVKKTSHRKGTTPS